MKVKELKKGINFIPDFMQKEKTQRRRMFIVALSTAVFTLLSFAVYFIPEVKAFTLSVQLQNIETEMRFLEDVKGIKNKLEDTQTKLDKKAKILQDIKKEEVNVIFLTDKLISAAPKNVLLAYFSVDGKDKVNINYIINNPVEATELVNNLKSLNIFEKVDMPNIPIVDRKTDVVFRLKLKDNILAVSAAPAKSSTEQVAKETMPASKTNTLSKTTNSSTTGKSTTSTGKGTTTTKNTTSTSKGTAVTNNTTSTNKGTTSSGSNTNKGAAANTTSTTSKSTNTVN